MIWTGFQFAIGLMLARTKTIKTVLIGGEIEANDEAAFGLDAMEIVRKYRVDLAFIGAGGISDDGDFTDYTRIAAEQRALMLKSGQKAYVLADRTKFSRRTPVVIDVAAQQMTGLITDALPKDDPAAKSAKRRWPVILAHA